MYTDGLEQQNLPSNIQKHSREAFSVMEVATSPPSFDDMVQLIYDDHPKVSYAKPNASFQRGVHGTTCYYDFNLFEEERYRPLMKHIMQNIYDSYRNFIPNIDFTPLQSWWTVYEKGAYIPRHSHYNSMISGVYYLRHPEGAGNISFYNPIGNLANHLWCDDLIFQVAARMRIQPKTGTLLLFPGWLEHETVQSESDEDKIIVSFNIKIRPPEGPPREHLDIHKQKGRI
tara:strand:+ start:4431 stop:5117 length:687 start_codon:yes stop_codon:yes gene_type:complete